MTREELEDTIRGLFMILDHSPLMWSPDLDRKTLSYVVKTYNRWAEKYRNPAYEGKAKDMWLEAALKCDQLELKQMIIKELKTFESFNLDNDEVKITVTCLDGTVKEFDGSWLVSAAEEMADDE